MPRPRVRILRLLILLGLVFGLSVFLRGRELLIAVDPLPTHVEAAVVLQGSVTAEKARVAGAMNLAKGGVADRVMIIVPKESFWGQAIAPVARTYLERIYGAEISARVDFCETDGGVDSTGQEAEAALGCVQSHSWRSLAVVTSDYHTRRAGILWRRALRRRNSGINVTMQGVSEDDFQSPWWRHRRSAKIWWNEATKLIWTELSTN